MAIDQYAPCPCGSGKKIKFCKCKDSLHEMERVMTMVQGGQIVPALDKLASVLKAHPDAAWALAIRGRLFLSLGEHQSLAENADRFTRLQPSNPMALAQKSAAALTRGDLLAGTDSMLEALTESGQSVDSFVLDIASLLAYTLTDAGVALTARMYAALALGSQAYHQTQIATEVLAKLNGGVDFNHRLKSIPERRPRPQNVDWAERFDEADLLLRNNKVTLAEIKLQSLQRVAPGHPAILSGLLHCAIWKGDADAQSDLLAKLSRCADLPADQRADALALSGLVSPNVATFQVPHVRWQADVQSVDEPLAAMSASRLFEPLAERTLAGLRDGEVAPKAGFHVLDREKPAVDEFPPIDQVPEGLGIVLVFGRQTDRPARLEAFNIQAADADAVRRALVEVTQIADWQLRDDVSVPIGVAAQPRPAAVRLKTADAAQAFQSDLFADRVPTRLANLPLGVLGGQSAAQSDDDLAKDALIRLIDGEESLRTLMPELADELAQRLGRPTLPTLTPDDEELEEVPNWMLNRVDPSRLTLAGMVFMLQRCYQVSTFAGGRAAALKIIETSEPGESGEEELLAAKMMAHTFIVQSAGASDEAVEHLTAGKALAAGKGQSPAGLLLLECGLRAQRGEMGEFQAAVNTIVSNHSQDEQVMGRLQQLLIRMGVLRPDGQPAGPAPGPPSGPARTPAPAGGGGGIWTPGSGQPPVRPAAAAPAAPAAGGSKLWVPGMK